MKYDKDIEITDENVDEVLDDMIKHVTNSIEKLSVLGKKIEKLALILKENEDSRNNK